MRRLVAFFDRLLGRAPLIVEPHYRPVGQAQIRDDEADSREQFPEVELHLRYYSPCCLPAGRLLEKALVPDHWLVARPPHGPRQQLRNVPLQIIAGWNADRIRPTALLQRLEKRSPPLNGVTCHGPPRQSTGHRLFKARKRNCEATPAEPRPRRTHAGAHD